MRNNTKRPPGLAEWIVKKISNPVERNSIIGDFDEIYSETAERKGIFYAQLWYWVHLFLSTPAFLKWITCGSLAMLNNYIKLSYRSLFKNKLYGSISIFSLAAAIGVAISFYVFVDLYFHLDAFHENAEEIFLIESTIMREGKMELWGNSPVPLGPALKSEYPQPLMF